jgi:carboxylesterase type B
MHDAWVSFAKDGVPTVDGVGKWPVVPADGSSRPVVLFDTEIALVDDPQPATRRFWTAVGG